MLRDKPFVYTIGYGAGHFDDLIVRVRAEPITHLVDVRTNPYSKYQEDFRGESFAARVNETGLKYVFMGDSVGGKPVDESVWTDGDVDDDKLRVAPFYRAGLKHIVNAAEAGKVLCLLCGCARPETCHRGRLLCHELLELGIDSRHLMVDGSIMSQADVELLLPPKQHKLF